MLFKNEAKLLLLTHFVNFLQNPIPEIRIINLFN